MVPVWVPVADQVAAMLRARTRDETGRELGEFTDDGRTRPSRTEVEAIIGFVVGEIEGHVGRDLPEPVHEQARNVAVLGAAARVELSYWPEQIADQRSAGDAFREMYDAALPRLAEAVKSYRRSSSAGGGQGLGVMVVRGVTREASDALDEELDAP